MNIHFLPQASTMAKDVDLLIQFILGVSLVGLAGVTFAIVYFVLRYWRHRRAESSVPQIHGHTVAEVSVAVLLTVLVMFIFYWGWVEYKKLQTVPHNSLEVNVVAKQWLWEFQYPDGKRLTNELVVPLGRPVKLIMTSQDVIHSFYVPNFRVKQDVLPKTYTSLWFEATELGEHRVFCAEYCGTAHSGMLAVVKVVSPEDFEAWQLNYGLKGSAGETLSLAEAGKAAFSKYGCQACHSVDGSKGLGPSQKGVFGLQERLEDGSTVMVDENYIRESLMEPTKKVVKGYQPVMPTFQGQLSDADINALIGYIKSLK